MLLAIVGAGYYFSPKDPAFHTSLVNPYLILCIVASAYYGIRESLTIAATFVATYLVVLHFSLDYKAVETIFTIKYLAIPILVFFLCPLISEFTQRREDRAKKAEAKKLEFQILLENKEKMLGLLERENLEIKKQLVTRMDTVKSLAEHSKGFLSFDTKELFESLSDIMREHLKISSAGIYLKKNANEYELAYEFGEKKLDPTINLNDPSTKLAKEAVENINVAKLDFLVRDNKVTADSDRHILAGPIVDYQDDIIGVVVIKDMEFLSYVPASFSTFGVYLEWFSISYQVGKDVAKIEKDMPKDPLTGFCYEDFFYEALGGLHKLQRDERPLQCIKVEVKKEDEPETQKRLRIFRLIAEVLKHKMNTPFLSGISKDWDKLSIYPFSETTQEYESILNRVKTLVNRLEINKRGKSEKLEIEVGMIEVQHPSWKKQHFNKAA